MGIGTRGCCIGQHSVESALIFCYWMMMITATDSGLLFRKLTFDIYLLLIRL